MRTRGVPHAAAGGAAPWGPWAPLIPPPRAIAATGTVVNIGYEGKTVGDLVAQLLQQDVRVLVDVAPDPAEPQARGCRRPSCPRPSPPWGIGYVHHRAWATRRQPRRFRAGEPESRARYRDVLDSAAATDALAHVCELVAL